jgi:hypothetical protein
LILSTPNANYTKPVNGKPTNPFHIFEYNPEELLDELRPFFKQIKVFGQVLDERYKIPPFQDAQNRLPKTVGIQTKLLAWRVVNKTPVFVRENLSMMLTKRPFYPDASYYHFLETAVQTAPVQLAVCRNDD